MKRHPEAYKSPEVKAITKSVTDIMSEVFTVAALPGKEAETLAQCLAFNAACLFDGEYNPSE